MGCEIVATGKALPERVVNNDELSEFIDTSDEWIRTRTGIESRCISIEETTGDLAARAGRMAMQKAKVSGEDIDLLICMTITPDSIIPSQAGLVKLKLGLDHAVAFDLNAACTGCIYGIEVAANMIEGSQNCIAAAKERGGVPARNVINRALVIGVDRMSRIIDWTDRQTCVLFGDGAGAVLLQWNEKAPGILASFLKNTDDDTCALTCGHLYDMNYFPFVEEPMHRTGRTQHQVDKIAEHVEENLRKAQELDEGVSSVAEYTKFERPFLTMNGQRVFKFAAAALVEAIEAVVKRSGVSLDDIDCIVPHQANERIVRYAAKKVGIPMDRFQLSISYAGNTSASSVLIALHDAYESQRIQSGAKVILVGFGGGLTSGSIIFEA